MVVCLTKRAHRHFHAGQQRQTTPLPGPSVTITVVLLAHYPKSKPCSIACFPKKKNEGFTQIVPVKYSILNHCSMRQHVAVPISECRVSSLGTIWQSRKGLLPCSRPSDGPYFALVVSSLLLSPFLALINEASASGVTRLTPIALLRTNVGLVRCSLAATSCLRQTKCGHPIVRTFSTCNFTKPSNPSLHPWSPAKQCRRTL